MKRILATVPGTLQTQETATKPKQVMIFCKYSSESMALKLSEIWKINIITWKSEAMQAVDGPVQHSSGAASWPCGRGRPPSYVGRHLVEEEQSANGVNTETWRPRENVGMRTAPSSPSRFLPRSLTNSDPKCETDTKKRDQKGALADARSLSCQGRTSIIYQEYLFTFLK